MKYLFLALAIIFEVIGSSFLNASKGFTKVIPSSITVIAYVVSFIFLSQALKHIRLGIVLTALISVFVFKQSLDLPAIIGIILIVTGVIVMNVFSKTSAH